MRDWQPALLVRAAIVSGLLLAGCGGADKPRATATPRATAAASPTATASAAAALPQPKDHCGSPDYPAKTLRFRTSDGVTLAGAVVGDGPVGAVLIHEYPGPSCGWWSYAVYLARHHVRALIFDLRCFGLSDCAESGRGHSVEDVAAAMDALRAQGADHVALIGASMGGAIATVAAATLHPSALVNLSGERDPAGLTPIHADAAAAAPRVTAPALFVVARHDRYTPVADMRLVERRARSREKRLIVLPTSAGHGIGVLYGLETDWSPLAGQVAAFVRKHA